MLIEAERRMCDGINEGQEVVLSGDPKHMSWFEQTSSVGSKRPIEPSRVEFIKEYPRYVLVRVFFNTPYGLNSFTESVNKSSGVTITTL